MFWQWSEFPISSEVGRRHRRKCSSGRRSQEACILSPATGCAHVTATQRPAERTGDASAFPNELRGKNWSKDGKDKHGHKLSFLQKGVIHITSLRGRRCQCPHLYKWKTRDSESWKNVSKIDSVTGKFCFWRPCLPPIHSAPACREGRSAGPARCPRWTPPPGSRAQGHLSDSCEWAYANSLLTLWWVRRRPQWRITLCKHLSSGQHGGKSPFGHSYLSGWLCTEQHRIGRQKTTWVLILLLCNPAIMILITIYYYFF